MPRPFNGAINLDIRTLRRNGPEIQASREAADGIRTHDLLHGKLPAFQRVTRGSAGRTSRPDRWRTTAVPVIPGSETQVPSTVGFRRMERRARRTSAAAWAPERDRSSAPFREVDERREQKCEPGDAAERGAQ